MPEDHNRQEDPFFKLRDRAYELAGMGRYKRWDQVAYALLAEGFPRELITRLHRDEGAVMMVTRTCRQARSARPLGILPKRKSPMLMFERERQRLLRSQARELANSGRYANWREVELALLGRGRELAPQALQSRFVRLLLNARCAHAKRRNDNDRIRRE